MTYTCIILNKYSDNWEALNKYESKFMRMIIQNTVKLLLRCPPFYNFAHKFIFVTSNINNGIEIAVYQSSEQKVFSTFLVNITEINGRQKLKVLQ